MRIGLTPPIAGTGDAHQTRILAVLHIADQLAVFDQHVLGRGCPFIINRDGAAPVGDRAVIQHRYTLGGDLLAHQPCKGRGSFTVEIALQPMANRLMQQNAGPAGAEDHVHHAGGGGLCL